MAGGAELEEISHELESAEGAAASVGQMLAEDVADLSIPHQTHWPGQPVKDPALSRTSTADRSSGASGERAAGRATASGGKPSSPE